jgi:hypothetical protein
VQFEDQNEGVGNDGGNYEIDSVSTASGSTLTTMVDRQEGYRGEERRARKRRLRDGLPAMEIKTRGAKCYRFERRTHRKILDSDDDDGNRSLSCGSSPCQFFSEESVLKLDSNPLHWSVRDVVDFLKTTDCCAIARLFHDQEIDGQSLMLLSLPAVQEYLHLKLGPAVKLCHQIERVKIAFFEQFA